MKYICATCGLEHEGRPSIAFESPYNYDMLNDDDKKSLAELSDDFCVIQHPEQTDRFVRAVLRQKVNDDCQTLDYGVWVSLSEESYKDYLANFNNENHQATYFGFLCNNLTGYEDTLSIKANVMLRGRFRPEVTPHDDQMDSQFVRDYYNGIDNEEAEKRLREVMGA